MSSAMSIRVPYIFFCTTEPGDTLLNVYAVGKQRWDEWVIPKLFKLLSLPFTLSIIHNHPTNYALQLIDQDSIYIRELCNNKQRARSSNLQHSHCRRRRLVHHPIPQFLVCCPSSPDRGLTLNTLPKTSLHRRSALQSIIFSATYYVR